jgi:dTMP kinase
MTGKFITFEGIEGAGKSTQIHLLADWLRATAHEPVITREPGGTALGGEIRGLVLHASVQIAPVAELLLYAADRAQHMAEIVEPALASGKFVLCDRHADSLVAYQAYGRELDRTMVEDLNRQATRGRKPDLTLILDLEPAEGLARVGNRGKPDRLERENLAFHQRVREGFLAIARAEPGRAAVLDARKPADAIHQDILDRVKSLLNAV